MVIVARWVSDSPETQQQIIGTHTKEQYQPARSNFLQHTMAYNSHPSAEKPPLTMMIKLTITVSGRSMTGEQRGELPRMS